MRVHCRRRSLGEAPDRLLSILYGAALLAGLCLTGQVAAEEPTSSPSVAPSASSPTLASSVPSALVTALSTEAQPCHVAWPRWEQFKHEFLSPDGRVIDVGSADSRTVSEGQAYALFFALVANDRPAFDSILRWTENNLAGGDLTSRLPAWLWGHAANGNWEVLDDNAAADADLWIAYALLEAGQLWRERSYTARGTRLAMRVLDEEAANLPGLGLALLPGPVGFHPGPDEWRLNPSYMPLQVIRGIATRLPDDSRWPRLATSTVRTLTQTAPRGFAPDWALYRAVERSGSRGARGLHAGGDPALSPGLHAGPHADGSTVGGPNVGGPNVGGPNVDGPNVDGPNVDGPNAGGPNAGGPNAGGSNTGAPKAGLSPGFNPDEQTHAQGGYDAIRVYLWLGMLDPKDENRAELLRHFAPFADYIEAHGAPAETVDTTTGKPGPNAGNAGFSAAAVPFLAARGQAELAGTQAARVDSLDAGTPPGYYRSVLTLFGLGWRDGRFRFAANGTLEPAWKRSCTAAPR